MWRVKNPIRHPLADVRWPGAAEAARSPLFSSISLGPIELETRTWVPAMVPWRASEEGFVTQNLLAWYARFAAGQPGAIVIEATGVRDIPSGPLLRIGHDRFIPGLEELARTVKRESNGHTKVFIQIIDFLTVKRRPAKETYIERFLTILPEHRKRLASATHDERWNAATEAEIRGFLTSAADELL